jgi:hypothetical protein
LYASLSGNLTLQSSRSDRANVDDNSDTTNGEWLPTATINLSYQHRRAFDVPRLVFDSNLRFISNSYLPGVDEVRIPDGRDDKSWDNRFQYAIGLMQLRLITRVSESRDQEQALLLFQVRRLFGDI